MAIRQPQHRIKPPTRPKWQSKYHGVRMTPEEYLALPEEKPYLEYIDGMVVQKPMPNLDHAELVIRLGYHFTVWLQSKKGRVGTEARTKLGDLPNYRLPDLSYWGPERPRVNDMLPTLAVEVRSDGQSMNELRQKCRAFRQSGVEACWLIDPFARTAELFEDGAEGAPIEVLKAACAPGFELPLADLFSVLDAPA